MTDFILKAEFSAFTGKLEVTASPGITSGSLTLDFRARSDAEKETLRKAFDYDPGQEADFSPNSEGFGITDAIIDQENDNDRKKGIFLPIKFPTGLPLVGLEATFWMPRGQKSAVRISDQKSETDCKFLTRDIHSSTNAGRELTLVSTLKDLSSPYRLRIQFEDQGPVSQNSLDRVLFRTLKMHFSEPPH